MVGMFEIPYKRASSERRPDRTGVAEQRTEPSVKPWAHWLGTNSRACAKRPRSTTRISAISYAHVSLLKTCAGALPTTRHSCGALEPSQTPRDQLMDTCLYHAWTVDQSQGRPHEMSSCWFINSAPALIIGSPAVLRSWLVLTRL